MVPFIFFSLVCKNFCAGGFNTYEKSVDFSSGLFNPHLHSDQNNSPFTITLAPQKLLIRNMTSVYIKDLAKYEGEQVQLQGWVYNKRSGKGLFFIVLRDGFGYCQCVVDEKSVTPETFEAAKNLTQESSFSLTGKVVKDERQLGGYEVQISSIEVLSISLEFPITKKEHGVDFLME